MAIPDFLKKKKDKDGKKSKKNKQDFRERCLELLEKIRPLSEDRYQELIKTFRQKYDKINISKKVISGFYAQLVQEYNTLRETAGETIIKTKMRVASHHRVVGIQEKLKQRAQEIEKVAKTIKKKTKKKASKEEPTKKKVTKKKAASSTPEKKATKKKAATSTPEKKAAKKKTK